MRIGLIFGGRSIEHDVSWVSAESIYRAMDHSRYHVELIWVDLKGEWHVMERFDPSAKKETLSKTLIETLRSYDVLFPIIHGKWGEDGCLQGFLEIIDVPYVGSGVLGASICMDKAVSKRLLKEAGFSLPFFSSLTWGDRENLSEMMTQHTFPCFIKPANAGSSIGISRVERFEEVSQAVDKAFQFDTKIVIENAVMGNEVECSVLGNEKPIASLPGRFTTSYPFYSFEAKYSDARATQFEVPAKFSEDLIIRIQKEAIRAYQTLECAGMARVDMFITPDHEIVINEVNTHPGFTQISLYPQLWEVSKIPYVKLIDHLINLALEKDRLRKKLFLEMESFINSAVK